MGNSYGLKRKGVMTGVIEWEFSLSGQRRKIHDRANNKA